MDNEIALREMNRIKEKLSKGITLDETMFEGVIMAIEALEKQIPIKVSTEYDDEFTCPVCEITTEDYDVTTLKVCPECGQKLRWD